MADNLSKLARGFTKAIAARERKPSEYTATAKVNRVDDNIAWVILPGSEIETPVNMAVSAKKGDNVRVRVSNKSAWIIGNATSPPTDDTEAEAAAFKADSALESASNAEQDAKRANDAANQAERSAVEAHNSAVKANTAANDALGQLGIVEDVVGVLTWVSDHGDYILSEDTRVEAGKHYFTREGTGPDDYTYVIVPFPAEDDDPSEEGWYELQDVDEAVSTYVLSHLSVTQRGLWVLPNGIGSVSYDLTEDTTVVQDKKYYVRSGTDPNYIYTKVVNPTGNPKTQGWYEETTEQHAPGYKMLLSNNGMYLYDDAGHVVSVYGESITFDSSRPQTIGGQNAYITYYDSNNDGIPDSIIVGGDNVTINSTVNIGGESKTLSEVLEDLSNTIIYDHQYEYINNGTQARFTAYAYQAGNDISSTIDAEKFTWYRKTESGEVYLGSGRTVTVNISDVGYGAEIVGYLDFAEEMALLSSDNSNLRTADNRNLLATVNASGESIRVRDLTKTTTLEDIYEVLVVTPQEEKLTSLSTLRDYVDKFYEHNQGVASDVWTITHNLNKYPTVTVIDSAGSEVEGDIDYTSANSVTLTFSGAFTGKAYLN